MKLQACGQCGSLCARGLFSIVWRFWLEARAERWLIIFKNCSMLGDTYNAKKCQHYLSGPTEGNMYWTVWDESNTPAPVDLAVARTLAMTGLVQYQPKSKSANKEVEDIKTTIMALCTQESSPQVLVLQWLLYSWLASLCCGSAGVSSGLQNWSRMLVSICEALSHTKSCIEHCSFPLRFAKSFPRIAVSICESSIVPFA